MKFLIVIVLYTIGVIIDMTMRKLTDKEIEENYQNLLRDGDVFDMPTLDNLYRFRRFAYRLEFVYSLVWPAWLIKDLITAMKSKET